MNSLFIFIFNLFFRAPALTLVGSVGAEVGRAQLLRLEGLAHPIIVIYSDSESSGESQPSDFQGINIPPIRTLIPEFADDMGRRNVVRLNLRDGAAARQKEVNLSEPATKKQKITQDFFPTRPPTPLVKEKDQTESSAAGGSKAMERTSGSSGRAIVQEFAPSFEDSVKLEPGLAINMLHGLALLRDMERVPPELQLSLVHASAYLVQAILCASNQAELVAVERTCYHEDLKVEREKVRSYKGNLKTAKARIAEMEKEKEEMADKLKKAERELGQVLRREKRKMKEVDDKAYQAGYDRAGAEYMRDARKMVNDEVAIRVPIAYNRGYKDGVKAACGVLQLEADMAMTKSIPGPVVP
ncbi:hypothetical protein RHMOL_Rhmol02G0166200 [Rhododendron molle]|uniref:Uncharacterized protein n=1 Tax=Rhododendron molle TaxID=49168 RepID=A0ACC0PR94_RHOML|nr:hypothetical protein RHMOL_Rhmol02G0166200 [Rhododendron molle]